MSLENDGKHVAQILAGIACKKHKAPAGDPCWYVPFGTKAGYAAALCGARIKLAGFNGTITAVSTQMKSSRGRVETGARRF